MLTALRLIGAIIRSLLALAMLLVVAVVFPWGMWHYVGWPLPHHLPHWRQVYETIRTRSIDDTVYLKALAVLFWPAWAVLMLSFIRETLDVVRGAAHRVRLGPVDTVAATIIGTIVLSLTAAARAPAAETVTAGSVGRPTRAVATAPLHPAAGTDTPGPEDDRVYVVRPPVDGVHESLWEIAEHQLGDPLKWREIYHLNQGRPQPDGGTLDDPELIRPGWRLVLPPVVTPHHPTIVRTPAHAAAIPRPTATHTIPPAPLQKNSPGGFELPTGGYIGISLVAAITAALIGARRYRRYRALNDPPATVEPPLSRVVGSAYRGYVRTLNPPDDDLNSEQLAALPPAVPMPTSPDGVLDALDDQPPAPGALALGTDQNGEITADLLATSGLGLAGPTNAATARALLAGLLATGRMHEHDDAHNLVLIPHDDLARLLPGVDVGEVHAPRLTVTDTLTGALEQMEIELLHRTTVCAARDVDSVDELRAHHAQMEDMPTVVLVADVPREHAERLRVILRQGRPMGITAILCGEWPTGTTVQFDRHSRLVDFRQGPDAAPMAQPERMRLFTLPPLDVQAILTLLDAARGARRWPTDPTTASPLARVPARPAVLTVVPPVDADEDSEDAGDDPPVAVEQIAGDAEDHDESAAPVTVSVLGDFRASGPEGELGVGVRSTAKELLLYLAVHRRGTTRDRIIADLWPESTTDQALEQFYTARKTLDTELCKIAGIEKAHRQARLVPFAHQLCRLDDTAIEVDLWQLTDALDAAEHATTDIERITVLDRVTELYNGDLTDIDKRDGVWAIPHRQDLRRQALNAMNRLVALYSPSNPHRAIRVLERIIEHDPYEETLYGQLMRLHAVLGEYEAVDRTLRLLGVRLREVDVHHVNPDIRELARRLRADQHAHSHEGASGR